MSNHRRRHALLALLLVAAVLEPPPTQALEDPPDAQQAIGFLLAIQSQLRYSQAALESYARTCGSQDTAMPSWEAINARNESDLALVSRLVTRFEDQFIREMASTASKDARDAMAREREHVERLTDEAKRREGQPDCSRGNLNRFAMPGDMRQQLKAMDRR